MGWFRDTRNKLAHAQDKDLYMFSFLKTRKIYFYVCTSHAFLQKPEEGVGYLRTRVIDGFVSCHVGMGIEPRSSARAPNALNY